MKTKIYLTEEEGRKLVDTVVETAMEYWGEVSDELAANYAEAFDNALAAIGFEVQIHCDDEEEENEEEEEEENEEEDYGLPLEDDVIRQLREMFGWV